MSQFNYYYENDKKKTVNPDYLFGDNPSFMVE